jgi:hypothetical protein
MNNTMSQPLDRVRDALAAAGCDPRGHSAKCPAHDDQSPSLSFGVGDDGKAVLTCHAGCDTGDILAALELTWADLFPEPEPQPRQVLATYDYTDADGKPLYQKVRYLPKGFSLRRLGPFGEWINNVQGVPLMPYHLPELSALKPGDRVYIAEGEKDVDRLRSLGLVATTNPTGAGNWQDWSEHFTDRDVVIIPDNDRAGWDHAIDVYTAVLLATRRTVLLQLPGLPDKGDVSDWLDAGHTVQELDVLADDPPKAVEPVAFENSAEDDDPPPVIDWANLPDPADDYVERLLVPGRWVQFIAGPKEGKSSLVMYMVVELSQGRHPFDGHAVDPVKVLYLDGEMGEQDLKLLLADLGHPNPETLTNLTCMAERLRLDIDTHAARLVRWVDRLNPQVVVLEGLNGFVSPGADENDKRTWAPFYTYAVEPLKQRGIAVVSEDNMGKDSSRGSRGSSVKSDKGDGVIAVRKMEGGVKLKTIFGRAGAYIDSLDLGAEGFDRSKPIRYWLTNISYPSGTAELVKVLDRLGTPANLSRRKVRDLLHVEADKARSQGRDPDEFRASSDVIDAAQRYRRMYPTRPQGHSAGHFSSASGPLSGPTAKNRL